MLVFVSTNPLDGLISVHDRHIDVHENDSGYIDGSFAGGWSLERVPVG